MTILTESPKQILVSSNEPNLKLTKSRNKIFGMHKSSEKIETEICNLAKKYKVKEIAEMTGKSERQIKRYIAKGKASGALNQSDSGRIIFENAIKTENYLQQLSKDGFKTKHPKVEKWVERRIAESKGNKTKINRIKSQLGNLKVICDTLQINPLMILAPNEDGVSYGGLENAMAALLIALSERRIVYQIKQKQPDPDNIKAIYRNFLISARSFATYNGVTIPKLPPDHILSGKKVSFGQYAHIKLSKDEINKCVEFLSEEFGKDSIQLAMFVFFYLTGTRANSIYPIKTSTITTFPNGWLSCRVYESKTYYTWTKYVPNDNQHFDILQNWFEKRQKDGKQFLFSESGVKDIKFHDSLTKIYKNVYKKLGVQDDYFYSRPMHALRHISAHYWLDRTGLNHAVVAKILGWKDVQTLISSYGEITDDQIFQIVGMSS